MFKKINQIIAVGSVDGILTTAAMLRLIGNENIDLLFTQAFAVDKIDVAALQPSRKIAFVDLAVNNRDKAMTKNFVTALQNAGHEIVAVCDEHCREDWFEILGNFDGLAIEPQSQAKGVFKSSGAVLRNAVGNLLDDHGRELCEAADAGDRMDFSTHFGGVVNQAVKSRIADDTRRVHLAKHFSQNQNSDETILGWIKEYEVILANHQEILNSKIDLGGGIIRVSTIGKVVDITTLMSTLYKSGGRVVVVEGEMFNKAAGRKERQVAFGTSEKFDLLAAVKAVVPAASGFAQKANVPLDQEQAALDAVRALLVS